MSSPVEVIVSGLLGTAAGVLSGFLGIGGGAILAPSLVFLLGVDQHRAQGISLAALLPPVGLPAVLAYRKSGVRIETLLVIALVFGFIVGAPLGAWSAHRIASQELRWSFALFLVLAAVNAMRAAPSELPEKDAPRSPTRMWVALPIGLVSGVLSGVLGVGGGLVALPLLRRFARLSRLEAQATTLAMMLPPIGLPAVYVYAREQGGLPWELLAAVAGGFALGAGGGARLARQVSARKAAVAYAVLLVLMAVMLVLGAR